MSNRAGYYVSQGTGYKSFVPNKLPPNPPISFDQEIISLLSQADRKLGRLDGVTQTLPNPSLFVAMYVQKEAVLSSQIEGTQASLSDILDYEGQTGNTEDLEEVVNYVNAMNYGLKRMKDLPLSLRLIREIHSILLQNGRGSTRDPGQFRSTQNWIGPAGCSLSEATFIPPAIPDMQKALSDLELYFYEDDNLPPLIKIALIHAQFETIHPFLDGNGRMGRLLITFWLCHQEILSQPLLYLSYFFKQTRLEYYDRLMDVRLKGDWESWVKYFLTGIASVSDEATATAKDILSLKTSCEQLIDPLHNVNYNRLLEYLFTKPICTKSSVADYLNVSFPTASKIIDQFCELKILNDANASQQRYKKFSFDSYIQILNRGTEINNI